MLLEDDWSLDAPERTILCRRPFNLDFGRAPKPWRIQLFSFAASASGAQNPTSRPDTVFLPADFDEVQKNTHV